MNASHTLSPQSPRSRQRQPQAWTATIISLCALAVLWFTQNFLAEKYWWATLLTYLPQHAVALPTAFLILRNAARGQLKVMTVNLAALVFITVGFLGLNVPLGWMYSTTRTNVFASAMANPPQNSAHHFSTAKDGAPKLRVMTYNILLGKRGLWDIAKVIKERKPDVLCLQEARSSHDVPNLVPRLQHALPGWHLVSSEETATFSRYPIISHRCSPLPKFKGRVLLETVLNVNGRRVTIFNVHLGSPQMFTPMNAALAQRIKVSTARREAQAHFVLSQSRRIKTPLLICGDFNTPPRGLIYRDFSERFQDSFHVAGQGFGYTFNSDLPAVRIDYIWSSSQWDVQRCWVPRTDASDHRPLMAELQLD